MTSYLLNARVILVWLTFSAVAHLTNAQCGSTELKATGKVASLTSPYYPDIYPSNLLCKWRISSEPGQQIVIKIDDVFIEDSTNCSSDSLTVYKSHQPSKATEIARFCGRGISRTIRTGSSEALLVFVSDVSVEESGFKLEYHAGEEHGCNKELTTGNGVVTSPRYPLNYPDQEDCTTLIRLQPGQRIYLNFKELNLEYDDDCKADYVEIFDGPNRASRSLGRFCRLWETTTVQSSSNELFLAFHSDELVNAIGFKAVYSSEGYIDVAGLEGRCSWEKSEKSGVITSPNFPNVFTRNTKCRVQIKGPDGTKIALFLEELDIPDCSTILEIQEHRRRNPMALRYCGNITSIKQQLMYTRENQATVEFISSGSQTKLGRGFKLSYFFLDDEGEEIKQFSLQQNDLQEFAVYPRNVTVKFGARHTLNCKPKNGFSRWFKNYHPVDVVRVSNFQRLLLNEQNLVISSMKPPNAGIYTCLSYSSRGMFAVHAWISMSTLEECPQRLTAAPRNSAVVLEGEEIILSCHRYSKAHTFGWLKNGEQQTLTRDDGVFKIPRVHLSDSGIYECWTRHKTLNCQERYSITLMVLPMPQACGRPKVDPNVRKPDRDSEQKIVGGRQATRGSYPWQVALYYLHEDTYFCGGSLVNDRWVLTAAHCSRKYKISDVQVYLGKNNIIRSEPGQISTTIKSHVPHPLYRTGVPNDHDIALLQLSERISFSDFISPVCLEMSNKLNGIVFSETTVQTGTVTGWGRLVENGEQPAVLQELVLPIQPKMKCKDSTEKQVTENMFCAGYDEAIVGSHLKKDACQGDSGGPFVVKVNGRWVVVGIVSWGEGCAREKQYGFYTKVDRYYDWIQNETNTAD